MCCVLHVGDMGARGPVDVTEETDRSFEVKDYLQLTPVITHISIKLAFDFVWLPPIQFLTPYVLP